MRITNSILQNTAINSLQTNLQAMAQLQTQVSTGQKYQTFADNPQDQSNVMQTSSSLRALDQYQRNIDDATSRSNLEDSTLSQLTDLLDRAQQISVQQGTATSSAANRQSAKLEVDNIIASAVSLGNTKYGSAYLFGGDTADTAPLSTTPPFYTAATPPSGEHETEISAGQLFTSTHNAKQVFLDTNTLQSLQALSTALGSNDVTGIGAASTALTAAQSGVQAVYGDLGARTNQLDVASSNITALKTNLTTFKSSLSEVDQATAMTNLVSRQTAYQSAMLATSRVIGMTLTDYLR
jgi:flagellar hook-associated protein 3 FlgL